MERWAAVQEADVHLATLRIYEADRKDKKSKPRCFLFLPPNRDPVNAPVNVPSSKSKLPSSSKPRRGALRSTRPSPSFVHPEVQDWPSFGPKLYDPVYKPYNCLPTTGRDEPDIYEVEICEKELESSYIVAYAPKEHNPKAPGYNPRAQPTNLMGTVKKQGFVKRVMSASYRRSVKERHKKANAPKRLVKRMEMSEMKKHLKGKGKTVFTPSSSGTRGDPPFVVRIIAASKLLIYTG
jgi:transcription initiation factor TFIIF subunit beta